MIKQITTFLLAAAVAPAATIVSVSSANAPGYVALGSTFSRAAASTWTQTGWFTGVSVAVEVATTDTLAQHQGTAWLTDNIGPGTSNANVIASTNFTFPVIATPTTPAGLTNLFSGLSLGPGTYYLILIGDSVNVNVRGWQADPGGNVTTASGVTIGSRLWVDTTGNGTLDASFIPDSTFAGIPSNPNMLFTVTGSAVPEPGTLSAIGLGLMGLGLIGRKGRRSIEG